MPVYKSCFFNNCFCCSFYSCNCKAVDYFRAFNISSSVFSSCIVFLLLLFFSVSEEIMWLALCYYRDGDRVAFATFSTFSTFYSELFLLLGFGDWNLSWVGGIVGLEKSIFLLSKKSVILKFVDGPSKGIIYFWFGKESLFDMTSSLLIPFWPTLTFSTSILLTFFSLISNFAPNPTSC